MARLCLIFLAIFSGVAQNGRVLPVKIDEPFCTSCKERFVKYKPSFDFQVVDDQVYMLGRNPSDLKKLCSQSGEALGLRIIYKNQFLCLGSTQPSNATWLYTPFQNLKPTITPNGYKLKLGPLPLAAKNKGEYEFILQVIKEQTVCAEFQLVNLERKNIEKWPIELDFGGPLKHKNVQKTDTLTLFYEASKTDFDVNLFKRYFEQKPLSKYLIDQVEIISYASVEGDMAENQRLYTERSEKIRVFLSEHLPKVPKYVTTTLENWDEFLKDFDPDRSHTSAYWREQVNKNLELFQPKLAKYRKSQIVFHWRQNTQSALDMAKASAANNQIDLARALMYWAYKQPDAKQSFATVSVPKTPRLVSMYRDALVAKYSLGLVSFQEFSNEYVKISDKNDFNWVATKLLLSDPKTLDFKNIEPLIQTFRTRDNFPSLYINYIILKIKSGANLTEDESLFVKGYFRQDTSNLPEFVQFLNYHHWLELAYPLIKFLPKELEMRNQIYMDYFYNKQVDMALLERFSVHQDFCKIYESSLQNGSSMVWLQDTKTLALYCKKCVSTYKK